eukprot:scaffold72590_cov45-Attheya_sp.AAC.1
MREGKMTHSSAIWVTDVDANDLGDDKQTSLRASPGVVVVQIGVFGFRGDKQCVEEASTVGL